MNLDQIDRKEFYTKFAAALRSGKYKRAEGALRGEAVGQSNRANPDEGMCCLGVACDVLNKEYGYGGWKGSSFNGQTGMPTTTIQKWMFSGLKLTNKNGTHIEDGIAEILAERNDSGRNFAKTAIVIDNLAKQIV